MKVSVMTSLGGWALCAILWVAPACKRTEAPPTVQGAPAGEQSASTQGTPAIPFELRADSTDVTLFWFDQWGNAHAVTRASEVPEANRERVRVDPVRPELRAAGWVFVADLRAPAADGRFTVRAVQSEAFAAELNPALAAMPLKSISTGEVISISRR